MTQTVPELVERLLKRRQDEDEQGRERARQNAIMRERWVMARQLVQTFVDELAAAHTLHPKLISRPSIQAEANRFVFVCNQASVEFMIDEEGRIRFQLGNARPLMGDPSDPEVSRMIRQSLCLAVLEAPLPPMLG